jgi:hypothetical protein
MNELLYYFAKFFEARLELSRIHTCVACGGDVIIQRSPEGVSCS